MALALEPAHQRSNQRNRRTVSIQEFRGLGDIAGNPLRLLHLRPPLGKLFLFAVLRRERFELFDGCAQVVRFARRRLDAGPMRLQQPLRILPAAIGIANHARLIAKACKGIEQHSVCVGIDQGPVVMLPVDLDEKLARLPHQLHADGLVVYESSGASIRRLNASENQVAVVIDTVLAQQFADRMHIRNVEDGSHLPLVFSVSNKRAVATASKRQREAVQQDGFSGASFSRQYRQPRLKGKIKPLDQYDIADR